MECPVCLQLFTATGQNMPLSLRCGHAMCDACVEFFLAAQQQGEEGNQPQEQPRVLPCAVCNQQTQLKENRAQRCGAGGIPINEVLVEVATELTGAQQGHTNTCTNCQHHNQAFVFFCNTCDKPICETGANTGCAEHITIPITNLATQNKHTLGQVMEQLDEWVSVLDQRATQVQAVVRDNTTFQNKMITRVQQMFSELRKTLDDCEQQLVNKIKLHHNASAKALNIHKQHFDTMKSCAQSARVKCAGVLQNTANDHTNHIRATLDTVACKLQAKHINSQCVQLCKTPLHEMCPTVVLVEENELATLTTTLQTHLEQQLIIRPTIVVDVSNASWIKEKCVATIFGTVELAWGNETETATGVDVEYEVSCLQPENEVQVVYRGNSTRCKLQDLSICGHQAVFELRACLHTESRVMNTLRTRCGPLVLSVPKLPLQLATIGPGITATSNNQRVVHAGPGNGHRFCFGDDIPRNEHGGGVVRWGVKVSPASARDPWVFVGIISMNRMGPSSHMSGSSFGWARQGCVYRYGNWGSGFLDWAPDDEATLRLDMDNNTLSLLHHRTNTRHGMSLPENTTWRVLINLLYAGSAVELFQAV